MSVLTPVPIDLSSSSEAAPPEPTGPVCSLQRSGSLWQLGIEAQELTTAIGQLAEQLEADDDDSRARALAELEAALLAEEGNRTALAAKADATCWVIEHLRGQAHRRGRAKPPQEPREVPRLEARGPNQVWSWDIERHEAPWERAVMKGHRHRPVAAGR